MPLEDHYKGGDSWIDFVSLFKYQWQTCSFQNELLDKVGGAENLAMVIYGTHLSASMEWIQSEVHALEGLTPIQCLDTESGINRLRTCLHRFPR